MVRCHGIHPVPIPLSWSCTYHKVTLSYTFHALKKDSKQESKNFLPKIHTPLLSSKETRGNAIAHGNAIPSLLHFIKWLRMGNGFSPLFLSFSRGEFITKFPWNFFLSLFFEWCTFTYKFALKSVLSGIPASNCMHMLRKPLSATHVHIAP